MSQETILDIMSKVFKIEKKGFVGRASSMEIEEWDSMRHFQLILAIEEKFGIEFTPEQVRNAVSLDRILEILGNTQSGKDLLYNVVLERVRISASESLLYRRLK